jgi:hypothetical protein
LNASVLYTNAAPLTLLWKLYSGPTNVTFSATNQTDTVVSFTALGTYTLMFSADNGIHTPAYDAVVVTITPTIRMNAVRSDPNVVLQWSGGSPPFRLERASSMATNWSTVLTTNGTNATLPANVGSAFFRVLGQ